MKTWMAELAVVAAVELAVAIAAGAVIELLGATAVVLSFAHGQVADRLAEAEAHRSIRLDFPTIAARAVGCHRWAGRYFVGKEIFWCAYFSLRGSWSALAGVALFLAYPLWRRWWRRRHPL